ncbi:DNA repair protein RecN [Reichenbachiella agarivorans]|uniref:DNA repair protein RecN n=1 Tax=Reichenbachiella agarivorans TaxID=2979464 RepID=A0ABY6CJD9_9BACT|nr:DNA repair protein RecN [Reichenbachiella agarivorans]UXP30641.1 DNA repair protein RecN [Reichenbachiella agarivorans]
MISNLSISNYALIRELNIEPHSGLNMITGETGAGKSIMLGAVGLLLGKRADVKALLDQETKCVVEAEFSIGELGLQDLFEENDLDYDDHTIIRREISPKGKSRAFVNDVPVTLDVLKVLGLKLIDIHSQNESLQLSKKEVKLEVIDDFAQSKKQLKTYQTCFVQYNKTFKKLEELLSRSKSAQEDEEYKSYLLDELVKAELQATEQEDLEEELGLLSNAEEIKLQLVQITNEFDVQDFSLNDRLRNAVNTLRKLAKFSHELEKLGERLDSATTEIADVVSELSTVQEGVEHNPERMMQVQQRLDLIFQLQQKHHVNTVQGLLDIQSKMEEEASNRLDLVEEIALAKAALESDKKKLIQEAEGLSEIRRQHIDQFCNQLTAMLKELGMPDGFVEVAYKRVDPWKMGIDEVEFLFTANKGIKPEPLGDVASGGEFSRVMFCVKYILATKTSMPTVIFDEIDTGVSGEIAIKLAMMMKKMAVKHQLIAISHLPQVAAKGDQHYFVYKDNQSDKTQSAIRKLDAKSRLEEIAKMIGGDNPSEVAISNAKELIGEN